MSQFEEQKEQKSYKENNDGCLRYLLIFITTLIGAFLAFYFVADYTIKTLLSPEHQMRKAEKMMAKMDREFMRDINKDITVISRAMPNPVKIENYGNDYVVEVLLKPFGNTAKNVNISVEDGELLKIEAKNDMKKGNRENMTNMVQTYKFDKKIDFAKMTQKEERGKLIITLPIDKD